MAREQFLPQQDRRTRRVRHQGWFTFVLGRNLDPVAPLFAKRFHYEGWGSRLLTIADIVGTDVFALGTIIQDRHARVVANLGTPKTNNRLPSG
jgi:hypothetical protein